MSLSKKYLSGLMLGVLVLGNLVACSPAAKDQKVQPKEEAKATVQTNFYQAINQEWLDQTEIPSDQPAHNSFLEMNDVVEERLKADIKKIVSGEEKSDIAGMDDFITYYKKVNDFDTRNQLGADPIKPYLKQIEDLKDLKDMAAKSKDWTLKSMALPFRIGINIDLKNTSKKVMQLTSPGILLPDATMYQDPIGKKQLQNAFLNSTQKVMTLAGYSEEEAKKLVTDTIAFDELIAQYAQSSEELADIESQYHITSSADVRAYSELFAFDKIADDLVEAEVTSLNVTNPQYFENFDKIVNDENFDKLKSWLLVQTVVNNTDLLSDELRIAGGEYRRAIAGIAEPQTKEDAAYELATTTFSETFSQYYGQKYFGQEAKQDVSQMVENIIAVYKKRLEKNDWLSDETKAKALEKLDSLDYRIGYPDKVSDDVELLKMDPDKGLIDNIIALSERRIAKNLAEFSEPYDKTQWAAPSFMVNAFYDPSANTMIFPAAILQAPFYSKDQSDAENYGGIGAVIGHELTHAFDSNGAKFDKHGNLAEWWTESDYKAFDDKNQAMIDLWDGLEIHGGKVNGKLTLTENVADAGGLSASLEALQTLDKDAKLEPFFENYAKIWRMKASEQYLVYLLTADPHAPNELRTNMPLKSLDAFYQTYDIKESDPMFLPKDKRVNIW